MYVTKAKKKADILREKRSENKVTAGMEYPINIQKLPIHGIWKIIQEIGARSRKVKRVQAASGRLTDFWGVKTAT